MINVYMSFILPLSNERGKKREKNKEPFLLEINGNIYGVIVQL